MVSLSARLPSRPSSREQWPGTVGALWRGALITLASFLVAACAPGATDAPGALASGAGIDAQSPAPPAPWSEPRPTSTRAPSSIKPSPTVAPVDALEHGSRAYVISGCAICHEAHAEGGMVGSPLAGTHLSFDTFLLRIRAPLSPRMPSTQARLLSDVEAFDMYLYLRSLTTGTNR